MSKKQTFIIVGASLAGAKAAEELRERGFDGEIVLIGSEPERPYERPPLTKDYLRGESEGAPFVHEEDFYAQHEITLLTGTTVAAIDPNHGSITLEGGRELGYDRLLLATGAEPRQITVPGAELEGIHHLRTLADCDLLRTLLGGVGHVAVVGAGWIGSEFAASAQADRSRGHGDRSDRPAQRADLRHRGRQLLPRRPCRAWGQAGAGRGGRVVRGRSRTSSGCAPAAAR